MSLLHLNKFEINKISIDRLTSVCNAQIHCSNIHNLQILTYHINLEH
jgi:hypothetical protein